MSDPANLLFIGLPGSGKTTFLAALWHVLSDQSGATALKLSKASGDRTYLNHISKEWRECSQVPRTNLQAEQVVVLHLTGEGFGAFDLSIPDLAGEAFKQQLTDRRISSHHDKLIQQATGVMLFVHPDVEKGIRLTVVRHLEATLPGSQPADPTPTNVIPNAWSPDLLPHQVQLVELLQLLLERTQRTLRVAVVVSAWDLVDDMGFPPHVFLARQLPLLQQFLEANDDLLDYEVFGVSAQGGDITIEAKKQALLELDDALKRVKVRHDEETTQDITKPIAWLLERG